eukprot:10844593-Karenia_brevis.AAC.1
MLPKEYQEEILKMESGQKKLEYDSMRAYVLNLAQQKASTMQPKMDIAGVDDQTEEQEKPEKPQENQEYPEYPYYEQWWGWG